MKGERDGRFQWNEKSARGQAQSVGKETVIRLPTPRARRNRRCGIIVTVALAMLAPPIGAQAPPSGAPVEEIVILRSLRLSRSKPTDFCAPARTGFPPATSEDRYDFLAVATDAGSGKVTSASGPRAGTLHACFGPSGEPGISSFYAEGEVGSMPLVGRGQCRTTKRDYPEAGITVMTCQLDLTGLPSEYVGGQLTTNTLGSRTLLGADTDPPGYTQPSIATVRLWRKR